MELLAPYWQDTNGYEDRISGQARKDKRVSKLTDREALLASFRAGEKDELVVASLACLVFDDRDLLAMAAVTDKMGVTIVDLHSGLRLDPKMRVWKLKEAHDAMEVARRGDITKSASERARELRLADTKRRADKFRDDWGNPAFTTPELLMRGGRDKKPMAYSVAVREMQATRPEAVAKWKHDENRRAGLAEFHAKRAAAKAAKGKAK